MILGAGFSKSLSAEMPLTDDLGNQVMSVVAARTVYLALPLPSDFEMGQFESWLSRIAEDQPDLTTPENLSNRALFELCSEGLASVLSDRVGCAKEDALSRPWLFDLLGTLHARQSTVITFNQDTLIESGVEAAHLYSWDPRRWSVIGPQPPIGWLDCLDGQPPLPASRWGGYGSPQPTFRLLKLHGSLNWYWRPGDETGATTACWFLPGTLAPDQAVPDEASALRRELPGRVPLIVPPAAGKTAYYRTPMLIQLWQAARGALSRANVRVSLLGYSVPPTDLVTSGILRETIAQRSNPASVLIDVVNPDPGPVCANLEALGIDPDGVNTVASVEEFVEGYQCRAAEELVEAVRGSSSADIHCPLLVGSGIQDGLKVIGLEPEQQGQVGLTLEAGPVQYSGTNVSAVDAPAPIELAQLLSLLDDPAVMRLTAVTQAGERLPVVAAAEYTTNVGARSGRWQVLVTARPVR